MMTQKKESHQSPSRSPEGVREKVQVWIFQKTHGSAKDAALKATWRIRCLLLQTNQERGQFWQPVTGSIEPGESKEAAALREAQEETGFDFQGNPIPTAHEFRYESRFGPAREYTFALELEESQANRVTLDPKEHEDAKWVSPHQALKELKYPSNKAGLRAAYRALFQKNLGLAFLFLTLLFISQNLAWSAQDARVTNDQSPLRDGPSLTSPILMTLPVHSRLRVSSQTKDGFFKARTQDNQVGWIHQADLILQDFRSSYQQGLLSAAPTPPRAEPTMPQRSLRVSVGPSTMLVTGLESPLGKANSKLVVGAPSFQLAFVQDLEERLGFGVVLQAQWLKAPLQVAGSSINFSFQTYTIEALGIFRLVQKRRHGFTLMASAGPGVYDSVDIRNLSEDLRNTTDLPLSRSGWFQSLHGTVALQGHLRLSRSWEEINGTGAPSEARRLDRHWNAVLIVGVRGSTMWSQQRLTYQQLSPWIQGGVEYRM